MAGAATTPGLTPLLPRMGRDFSLPPPNVAWQNARRPRLLFAPVPRVGSVGLTAVGKLLAVRNAVPAVYSALIWLSL